MPESARHKGGMGRGTHHPLALRALAKAIALGGALLHGLMRLLLLAAIALALLMLRLSVGPIEAGFLKGTIVARVTEATAGLAFDCDSLALSWHDTARRIVLEARNARLSDDRGAILATAPLAGIRFHLPSLIKGAFNPTRLFLTGVHLNILRDETGRFGVALARPEDSAGDRPKGESAPSPSGAREKAAAYFLATLASGDPLPGALGYFHALDVRGATIRYEDRMSTQIWYGQQGRVALNIADETVIAHVRVRARQTGVHGASAGKPVDLAITARRTRGERATTVTTNMSNAVPADIAGQFPDVDWLHQWRAPVAGIITAHIADTGDLAWLRADLAGGAGEIRLGDEDLRVSGIEVTFLFRPDEEKLTISGANIRSDRFTGELTGDLILRRSGARSGIGGSAIAGAEIEGDIRSERLSLILPDAARPLLIENLRLHLAIGTEPLSVEISRLRFERAGVLLSGEAVWRNGATPASAHPGRLSLSARALNTPELLAIWPEKVATDAKAWIQENARAARFDTIDNTLFFDHRGQLAAMDLRFAFSKGVMQFIAGLPPLENMKGEGAVTLKTLAIALNEGNIAVKGEAPLSVKGSRFSIPDLNAGTPSGAVTLKAAGALRAAMILIDTPPLSLFRATPIEASDFRGQTKISGQLSFPLLRDLPVADVHIALEGQVHDLLFDLPPPQRTLRAPRMDLAITQERLEAWGEGTIEGIRMQILWEERFAPPRDEPHTRVSMRFSHAREKLLALGIPGENVLHGAMQIKGELTMRRGDLPRFTFIGDMSDLALSVPLMGWEKKSGVPGELRVGGQFTREGGLDIAALSVVSQDLWVQGALRISADRTIERADLHDIRSGHSRIALTMTRAPTHGADVRLSGRRLDIRPFSAGEAEEKREEEIRIGIALDRLDLLDEFALYGVSGVLAMQGQRMGGNLIGSSSADSRVPVIIDYRRNARGAQVRITTNMAGAFLRSQGLYADLVGGALQVEADIAPDGAVAGHVRIDDFIIRDDSLVEDIIEESDPTNLPEGARERGTAFSRAKADFTTDGSGWRIEKGVASGAALGLTFEGTYRPETRALRLQGVLSPLHVINGLLGEVPIVGALFTGGEGQGVFGVVYNVTGTTDAPAISVNPLSAFALGPLRNLFLDPAPVQAEGK